MSTVLLSNKKRKNIELLSSSLHKYNFKSYRAYNPNTLNEYIETGSFDIVLVPTRAGIGYEKRENCYFFS
ncbi:hypothetical protein SAMN05660197_1206 [Nitratiruptor tergarcus DSM 16512]|uniref:Uncharacterized protein n=1 Tax=Nitratiruptor tergarcus DSM 16512 TaxID=1069081 RepID=A0A1W1WT71_9BACT|nr:hypothetical protein SAMN05660197_1206 [Nitratiruptor tergarcus DSM 16512]